jgi:hypothetical protein
MGYYIIHITGDLDTQRWDLEVIFMWLKLILKELLLNFNYVHKNIRDYTYMIYKLNNTNTLN